MARTGLLLLDKHYNRVSHAATVTMVLDPRLNIKYCRSSNSWRKLVDTYVLPQVKEVFRRYQDEENVSKAAAAASSTQNASSSAGRSLGTTPASKLPTPGSHQFTLTTLAESDEECNAADFLPASHSASEVETYTDRHRELKHVCPFAWWSTHREEFPILHQIAMDHMAIPATSIAAEQLFSGMGLMCTARRNRLKPQRIRELVSIKNWLEFSKE
jgi:hypothetical protein